MILEILFCISVFIPIYVYAGYPLVLFFLQLFFSKTHQVDNNFDPKVTLIISCYNEAEVIEDKIKNCLEIEYKKENIEFIFISDGSTDGTDEIIKKYPEVRLIRQEGRLGKTSGLNMAVPEATSEFLVFSDANALYQQDAIKKLIRNFYDKSVGYVVGAAIYIDGNENSAAKSENSYWEYEIALKKWESKIHSVVGGDGAIYAIRKELYEELDAKDINDFVNPLQIIAKGYRGIFDPEAICHEETAGDFNKEARRKERIVNRSFRGLLKVKRVLNPFVTGFFSFQVISHKLLRWLIPFFLIGIAIFTTVFAYQDNRYFQVLYAIEMIFLWLAVFGFFKRYQKKISPIFFIPYYFLMVNFYSLIGIIKALSGKIQVTWSSPRVNSNHAELSRIEKTIGFSLIFVSFLIFIKFLSL